MTTLGTSLKAVLQYKFGKRNNRTIRTASVGLVSQQLLKNTSIETTSGWTLNGVTRSTTKPRTGAYSIKGTLSSNGSQYAMKSSEMLTAGKAYTVSAYVNTSEVTRFEGGGIQLVVTDGTQGWHSSPVNYITSSDVDGGWVRISVTFTAPTTDTYGITVVNSGAIGTFYADDFQMEQAEAPSSYNLLENGSMELSNHGWTMGTGAAYSTAKGVAASSTSIKITGDPEDDTTNAYQDVVLNQPGTQTYVLSGWVNRPLPHPWHRSRRSGGCRFRHTPQRWRWSFRRYRTALWRLHFPVRRRSWPG